MYFFSLRKPFKIPPCIVAISEQSGCFFCRMIFILSFMIPTETPFVWISFKDYLVSRYISIRSSRVLRDHRHSFSVSGVVHGDMPVFSEWLAPKYQVSFFRDCRRCIRYLYPFSEVESSAFIFPTGKCRTSKRSESYPENLFWVQLWVPNTFSCRYTVFPFEISKVLVFVFVVLHR